MSKKHPKLPFNHIEYVLKAPPYPKKRLLEFGVVGRSNVGKSSLINHLLNHKIAYSSSAPGKTQHIHYFCIDSQIYCVDLPGYGYAKVSHKEQKRWANELDAYFSTHHELFLVLVLLDIRRDLSNEDLMLFNYLEEHSIPFTILFTKKDKIKKQEQSKQENKLMSQLHAHLPFHDQKRFISYSIKDPSCRLLLKKHLNECYAEASSSS